MKVRYTDTALREVDEILSYIAKDNPLAADEVAALLQATVRRLANYPRLAIETDEAAGPGGTSAPLSVPRLLYGRSGDRRNTQRAPFREGLTVLNHLQTKTHAAIQHKRFGCLGSPPNVRPYPLFR
jgi:plasmid stabilization system protein ParE